MFPSSMEDHVKIPLLEITKVLLMMLVLALFPVGAPSQNLFAAERPVKEFFITVQEMKITLLEDPKKEVTVWAYALKGEKPSVPGPVIRVNKGDLVKLHFSNTHSLPHTMHFHGIHPFNMDGNGQRSLGREQVQMPNESYTYEWIAEDPGFFLYHCHFDTANHLDHGMYGMFVVEDPAWPQVDKEFITIWDEWDTNDDGQYDTHTINTRSAPNYIPLNAKPGDRVRIILANIGFEFHTPHLHGHQWQEMNPGELSVPFVTNPNGVVSIGPAEIKIVEFVAKHAGTWLFHCHVVPHVADNGKYPRGMLTVLKVTADDSIQSSQSEDEKDIQVGSDKNTKDTQVASIQEFRPLDQAPGLADRGSDVYTQHCKSCHGTLAKGEYGPKLQENPILQDDINFWTTVLKGRGNMPAWEKRLSSQDIADVQAYLKTLKPPPPP